MPSEKTTQSKITIEDIATFCKRKGFVYPSSEIYNGFAGFWDFGPLGIELFNNIKQSLWKFFVHSRDNMVGIEASIISHPRTWKASGHIENFGDVLLTCSKCKSQLRADHFIQEKLNINVEGYKIDEINSIIKEKNLKCPKCNSNFEEIKKFNLLFPTKVGSVEDKSATAYLRGETAQGMFLDFKAVAETSRVKLPFGILQVGRCFRNEIAPRDFLFRSREFNIGEFEFFINPKEIKCNLLTKEQLNLEIPLLTAEVQEKGKETLKSTTISELIKTKKLEEWHGYWLAEQIKWFKSLGISTDHLKVREHMKTELAFYSSATFDTDYLYPFGSHEIAGNANRGQYDLNQHIKESGKDLSIFDEASGQRIVPKVIEPTFGMERVFMAVLCEAYSFDEKRQNIVLKLNPKLAPIKAAILPIVKKEEFEKLGEEIVKDLRSDFYVTYDKAGSIGRRYSRNDEIGTPFCIVIDEDSVNKKFVTLRDRDSTKQIAVKISELKDTLRKLINKEIEFEKAGKLVETRIKQE